MSKLDDYIEEIRKGFEMFDVEGKGTINPFELRETLDAMNAKNKNPFIYDIVESFCDEDYKNGITIEQLINEVEIQLEDNKTKQGLDNLFNVLTGPKNDTINFSTFSHLAREVGDYVTEEQLRSLLEKTQLGGKELTIEDFYEIMIDGNVEEIKEAKENKPKKKVKEVRKEVRESRDFNEVNSQPVTHSQATLTNKSNKAFLESKEFTPKKSNNMVSNIVVRNRKYKEETADDIINTNINIEQEFSDNNNPAYIYKRTTEIKKEVIEEPAMRYYIPNKDTTSIDKSADSEDVSGNENRGSKARKFRYARRDNSREPSKEPKNETPIIEDEGKENSSQISQRRYRRKYVQKNP